MTAGKSTAAGKSMAGPENRPESLVEFEIRVIFRREKIAIISKKMQKNAQKLFLVGKMGRRAQKCYRK